ncbi:MAG TPA: pitrilysin family protein [Thermoanaerobaculia bacterium]|nr:pitrilysin family protein [Thermoanaerobaculia bacterium]
MRQIRLILILLVVATTAAAAAFPPINYKHRVLPNGLEVFSAQDRSTPTVAIHVWYRVGSKNDPEGRSGFAHLFEHIMFKATRHMKAEMMDRLTEDVGGWNNASTYDDMTPYFEVVPSNYLETLLWAEADRMGGLTVDEANFKSERDVVKEEYRFRVLAPPYGRFFNAIEPSSLVKHPYRRPGIGSMEDLDAATLDDVRAFHATFYRPDNAALIVVGDFDQQQFDAWVDKYFAPIPKPSTPIPVVDVQEPARTAEKRVPVYAPNVPLPAVALTYLAPAASSPDSYPLAIAEAVLSQGESSRLYERLVRSGIAQEAFANADLRADLGLFAAAAIMASGHDVGEAEKIIREELQKIQDAPISAAELEKAKNQIITSALRERETSNGKAFAIGEALVVHKDASIVNTGLARLQAVTAADVQNVMKKTIGGGKAVVITYMDESKRDAKKSEGGAK